MPLHILFREKALKIFVQEFVVLRCTETQLEISFGSVILTVSKK